MIPAERAHLNVMAISHPGMSGKNNEDRYGVSAYRLEGEKNLPSLVAVVADGIGGHRAGEVAAEIAVETISSAVADSDGSQPVETLANALVRASQRISDLAEGDPSQKGMGSTCACAWIIGSRLYTISVGDSRIYLIRDDTIRQLTTDHTWVQEAIEHGILDPEEARSHPNAHVIRRYLGSRQDVVPDGRLFLHRDESDDAAKANQGMALLPGDILLLCSDGLTDLVDDNEIMATLRTRNLRGALDDLVKMTNRRGGHDNVTILTLAVPPLEQVTIPVEVRRSRVRNNWVVVASGVIGLALLALAVGAIWMFTSPDAVNLSATDTAPVPQATLFPLQATLPGIQPPLLVEPSASPAETVPLIENSTRESTPLSVTLTPWPTNTLAP